MQKADLSPEEREQKVSAANRRINEFFQVFPLNVNGDHWFSPGDKRVIVPGHLREIAVSIDMFFLDKSWHAGGQIPDELLHNKRNYKLINNATLIDALDLAYKCIAVCRTLAKTGYQRNADVRVAIRVIHECERHGIPQDYIGGMLLLYLELCEKVELL